MMLEAIGGLALVLAAFGVVLWLTYRAGDASGYERHLLEVEAAAVPAAYSGRHQLAAPRLQPFPDHEPFEKMATTGELRQLAYDGDIGEIERLNTAWFRIKDLRRWAGIA